MTLLSTNVSNKYDNVTGRLISTKYDVRYIDYAGRDDVLGSKINKLKMFYLFLYS